MERYLFSATRHSIFCGESADLGVPQTPEMGGTLPGTPLLMETLEPGHLGRRGRSSTVTVSGRGVCLRPDAPVAPRLESPGPVSCCPTSPHSEVPPQLQPLRGGGTALSPPQRSCAQTVLPQAWAAARGRSPGQGPEDRAPDPEAGARTWDRRPHSQRLTHRTEAPLCQAPRPLGPVSVLLCSRPGETAGPESECSKGPHAAQPHGGNSHRRAKPSSSCRKARNSLEGGGQAQGGGAQLSGGGRVKEDSDLWGLSWGWGGAKPEPRRQAGLRVSCSHGHPLSKAALAGNELPVTGSSYEAGKPPVRESIGG